jgi:hypothetical protein
MDVEEPTPVRPLRIADGMIVNGAFIDDHGSHAFSLLTS